MADPPVNRIQYQTLLDHHMEDAHAQHHQHAAPPPQYGAPPNYNYGAPPQYGAPYHYGAAPNYNYGAPSHYNYGTMNNPPHQYPYAHSEDSSSSEDDS